MAGAERRHPAYKQLSRVSGQANALTNEEVLRRIKELKLDENGDQHILFKRLRSHLRAQTLERYASEDLPPELQASMDQNPHCFEFLLVVDFEATCEEVNPPDHLFEIIEFPALLFRVKDGVIVDQFHMHCRPVHRPQLSPFCQQLTGISQEQVEAASTFADVFKCFEEWVHQKELFTKHNCALLCDGAWDIARCLYPQCVLSQIPFPHYANKWLDVRKLFAAFYRTPKTNIEGMLDHLGKGFVGRQHCGRDDAKNIVTILQQLLKDGCILKYNQFLQLDRLKPK